MEKEKLKEIEEEISQEKIEMFVEALLRTGSGGKAYLSVYPGVSKKTAYTKAKKLVELPMVIAYKDKLLGEVRRASISSLDDALEYLSRVMNGEEKDQFGLDASLRDRTEAADKIIRYYGGYKDRQDVNVNVNFADALKEARQRAALAITERTIDAEVVEDGGET